MEQTSTFDKKEEAPEIGEMPLSKAKRLLKVAKRCLSKAMLLLKITRCYLRKTTK